MKPQQSKPQTATEEFQDAIIIDATPPAPLTQLTEIIKICWKTGEQKNCQGCYLSKGCKASE